MFSLLNGVYETYLTPPKLNVLMVGGQGAGKSTLLERTKVTQFAKNSSNNDLGPGHPLPKGAIPITTAELQQKHESPVSESEKEIIQHQQVAHESNGIAKRRNWLCPAPSRYQHAAIDDDEHEDEHPHNDAESPLPQPLEKKTSTKGSMESIDLNGNVLATPPVVSQEFNLKRNCKMLPLDRIRPTIGMNLAKNIAIHNAKCHIMDLGGKLIDLWDRYYMDADALIFVWKLDAAPNHLSKGSADDDDERPPPLSPEYQLELLNKVRGSIPDDVPFLIVAQVFGSLPRFVSTNKRYSTSHLLPHYHNPLQALFFADSKTGDGVKTAMEWVVPLAKRQLKIRASTQNGKL